MLPLILDLKGRLCVVVGGGPVGRRKANALLEAGATVRLVCQEARPSEAPPALDWHSAPYRPQHLNGAALVFAAATPEINRQVVADCRTRGLWVNSATEPECGDFFLPATVRRGDFVLAVSTGGAAPALAAAIRRRLEDQFDAAFGQWVALLAELRPLVLACLPADERRRDVLAGLSRWEWLDRLRRDGPDAVRAAMRAAVEAARPSPNEPL